MGSAGNIGVAPPLLEGHALKKYYVTRRGQPAVRALDGVSFVLNRGETLGIVGESGSGKTTLSRLLLRLESPTEGDMLFDGENIASLEGGYLKRFRESVQAVFQNPYASLNPRMKIGRIVAEPLAESGRLSRVEIKTAVEEHLSAVGLNPRLYQSYPHELSGGQRQRVAIARALSTGPDCIILDEPVAALDMSIRAQIVNLLTDLQRRRGISYIFIAHDLAVVRQISHHVAVMYLGKIVETGTSDAIYSQPLHPYTQALLANTLSPDPDDRQEGVVLSGEVPSPLAIPSGCRFHPRCAFAMPQCSQIEPSLEQTEDNRLVACHLYSSDV